MSNSFLVTKYYVSFFSKFGNIDTKIKLLSTDEEWESLRLLRCNVTPNDIWVAIVLTNTGAEVAAICFF